MRPLWSSLLLLGCSGCFAMSRDATWYLGRAQQRDARLDRIERVQRDQTRIERLEDFLHSEAGFDQPLSYYQQLRETELGQLGSSNRAKLSEEAAAGVPIVFKRRLDAILRAQLALANARLEVGNTEAAFVAVSDSIARTQRQQPTRADRADWLAACFALAARIHERAGAPGRARAARLQSELIADYLRSEAGRSDYLDREAFYHGDVGAQSLAETNRVVTQVNNSRLAEQASQNRRIAAAASGISAAAVRAAANTRLEQNGGVMTPEVQRSLVYADMLEMNAQALGAGTGDANLEVSVSLSPAASDIILTQFADAKLRVNALDLVEEFAREIPALAGRPELEQHATRAIAMIEQVRAVATGEPKEQVDAGMALATELGAIVESL